MFEFTSVIKSMLLLLIIGFTANANATWSVIAVDRNTGEIGIAGASCTFDVQGVASIVPGKGAIVVQAASDYFARMKGVELMRNDAALGDVLAAMKAPTFNPERQQYGVISLSENLPLVYSGNEINAFSGSLLSNDVAVMGNLLVSKNVLDKAHSTYQRDLDNAFSARLMAALKAGEQAGGDKRCTEQFARSAFISLYNPNDDAILKLSVHGIDAGGKPAVTLLDEQFRRWQQR